MVLFINPISENITFFIIENGEVRHTSTIPKGKDYYAFPEEVITIIDRHNIDTIWCVIGPGAFTRMRIITLALNTLSMVKNIPLKGCHFFDTINHPNPILMANDREYIIHENNHGVLREKNELDQLKQYFGYGNKNDFTDTKNFIEYREDIAYISRIFEGLPSVHRLSPIYLKEAHITWSKKNTLPSSKTTSKS